MNSHENPVQSKPNTYEENKKKVISFLKEVSEQRIKFEHRDKEGIIFFISKWLGANGRETMHECVRHSEFYKKKSCNEAYSDCVINKNEKSKIFPDANIYGIARMLKGYGIDATRHSIDLVSKDDAEEDSPIITAMQTSQELTEKYKDYFIEFILNPLIFKNGVNIFGAERGTGKTRISLAIAFAIIYGLREYLGYKISAWGDILFLNFELAEPEFKLFVLPIENYFKTLPNAKKQYEFHCISFKSYPELSLKDIAIAVEKTKPLLIIVDGFKAFSSMLLRETGEREITNANAMKVYNYFDAWKRLHPTTILF